MLQASYNSNKGQDSMQAGWTMSPMGAKTLLPRLIPNITLTSIPMVKLSWLLFGIVTTLMPSLPFGTRKTLVLIYSSLSWEYLEECFLFSFWSWLFILSREWTAIKWDKFSQIHHLEEAEVEIRTLKISWLSSKYRPTSRLFYIITCFNKSKTLLSTSPSWKTRPKIQDSVSVQSAYAQWRKLRWFA